MASPQRKRRGERGQSLVEFSMVLPVFLLILVGILDFGFMLFSRITVINVTREGARVAVSQGETTAEILAIDESMDAACASGGWIRCNIPGLVGANLTVVTTCQPPPPPASQAACDFDPGGSRDAVSGDYVRVTATYAYQPLFTRFFGSSPIGLSAQTQVVIE